MRLAALRAQGTLNFYLTHVKSAWAIATFSSPALQILFSFFGFHIMSTRVNQERFLSFALCRAHLAFSCSATTNETRAYS